MHQSKYSDLFHCQLLLQKLFACIIITSFSLPASCIEIDEHKYAFTYSFAFSALLPLNAFQLTVMSTTCACRHVRQTARRYINGFSIAGSHIILHLIRSSRPSILLRALIRSAGRTNSDVQQITTAGSSH
jgi:hypothetical protein